MKKTMWTVLALLLLCLALPAVGEEIGYTIDAADEITVGLGETIHLPFERPYSHLYKFNAYCSDPDALKEWKEVKPETTYTDTTLPVTGTFDVSFQKKGTFDLHITFEGREIRTISVTVDDLSTAASLSRERFVLRAGETVNTGLTLENGAMYNLPTFTKDAYYDSFVQISEDGLTLKGLSKGHMTIHVVNPLKQELCQFEVVVVEESENIELSCPQEYAVVGKNLTLSAKSNGEEAFPLVTITEGSDCVRWDGDSRVWSFYPFAPGWVTFTAYGTDGSTSSVRIPVLSGGEDIVYDIPKTTLSAGESVNVSVVFPSNAWFTIELSQPAERGLEGTVALVNNNRLTAVTAGTCNLVIHGVNVDKVIPITVTDSPQALTVIRPNPYMNMESSFQLSVQDKLGNVYPAQYSASGYVSVDENGLLTATEFAGNATVQVELENGAEYSFDMWTRRFPKELTCTVDELSIALNDQYQGINSNDSAWYVIYDELGAVSSHDIVVCSDDPSIITTELEGNKLHPQSVGRTTLTVWSKYCDVSVRVPIQVTEPMADILYVDGRDNASIMVPEGQTVDLPVVRDYYGNPVSVTWTMKSCASLPFTNGVKAFRLTNNGTKIQCLTGIESIKTGATLVATAENGATLTCHVTGYKRYEQWKMNSDEITVTTGTGTYVSGSGVSKYEESRNERILPSDATYTLTGDTDSIEVKSYHPNSYYVTGVKPGTVTLTVTLYNGFSASTVIHVTLPEKCKDGHDPVWKTEKENNELFSGTEALRCSRCNAYLGQTRETPATGVITFAQPEFYVVVGEETELLTQVNGSRHYSFVWESSDPSVATVSADKLTALQPGTVTITAVAYDCKATVTAVSSEEDPLEIFTSVMSDCAPAMCRVRVVPRGAGIQVRLPASLSQIGDEAFENTGIGYVEIPEGVRSIGNRAFADCAELKYIRIPDSVISIAPDAFDGSPQVVFLTQEGSTAADYAQLHGIPVEQ